MAILFDKTKQKYVELQLHNLDDPEWITYKLYGGEILLGLKSEIFSLDREEELFFHDDYEKEVVNIISNLQNIKRKGHFSFQPKDEGEFVLTVNCENDLILVRLLFRVIDKIDKNKMRDNVFEIETTEILLEEFLFELQNEYCNVTKN